MSRVQLKQHPHFASVRFIVLNRPDKHNALTLTMWEQLLEFLEACEDNPDVRVVVLRGIDEHAFCAGADIAEFPKLRANRESAKKHKTVTDLVTKRLANLRPITVAAISGICYGGGLQLASACDLRVADDSARFAITPVKLGFVYGPYETRLLMRIVGEPKAKELLYTGKAITAQEAEKIGLITARNPSSHNFDQFVDDYLFSLLQAAPHAQQLTKQIFHGLQEAGTSLLDEQLENLSTQALDGSEYVEGIQAFLEKRRPFYAEGLTKM
ncbi:enoyl-CoA hydratase/isomerase family protein [Sulfoacidibacillus thermotolerans]|uniref:enoyl-CoA hydratase/isomerase family protein n=1 Tax=Sulfoacidibacillus thermotolerans TaxID=1765684 RepID=UPI0015E801F2|nr:enoyl-CoA hydratase/isomerase family protein [Sulfoacidibacillus thermotolerans]